MSAFQEAEAVSCVYLLVFLAVTFLVFVSHALLTILQFGPHDLLVEIFLSQKVVNMVGGKVVAKKLVVDRGTHENDSHFRVLSDDSLDGEKDEIGVNVPFMYLIQDDEGVFFEEVAAVHQSLQENAVCHEDDLVIRPNVSLHTDLVPNSMFFLHL